MANPSHVSVNPEVLGGQPCFTDTTIPVDALFVNLAAGERLEVILDAFPGLSREAAIGVLRDACQLVRQRALDRTSVPAHRRIEIGSLINESDWEALSHDLGTQRYQRKY
jgi:uncharacterized protein (DUF433 family)